MPKASMLVLPMMIAPAALSLATAVASNGGLYPALQSVSLCLPLMGDCVAQRDKTR